MTQSRGRLRNQLVLGLIVPFFVLLYGTISAQIFVEEGISWGLDSTITTSGLGGPGVSTIDFDQDGDDDLSLGSNGNVLFYEKYRGSISTD